MNRDAFMENAPASWDALWRKQDAKCPHCRGTGSVVVDWKTAHVEACFACNGTGNPVTKMAYNLHRG